MPSDLEALFWWYCQWLCQTNALSKNRAVPLLAERVSLLGMEAHQKEVIILMIVDVFLKRMQRSNS